MGDNAKKVLDGSFREWLAGMCDDFSDALKGGLDPEVTFEVNGVAFQIRLMHVPGEYTRDGIRPDVLAEILKDQG